MSRSRREGSEAGRGCEPERECAASETVEKTSVRAFGLRKGVCGRGDVSLKMGQVRAMQVEIDLVDEERAPLRGELRQRARKNREGHH